MTFIIIFIKIIEYNIFLKTTKRLFFVAISKTLTVAFNIAQWRQILGLVSCQISLFVDECLCAKTIQFYTILLFQN
mgnify:CR=1 FL=1